MKQLLTLIPDVINALRQLSPPALVAAALWLATLAVILVLVTGCGALTYQPQTITTTTTTKQELPHDQATESQQ